MSLQVWLPLNGNTKQQGTSDIIMSGSPNSWGNAGKIGQCATFAGNVGNDIYNNTTAFNYVDNFSWCIWVNTKYTGTASQYVFTVGRADAGGYGYGLQCNNTSTCSCRYGNKVYSVSVTDGTWTHLAFTKSGTTINLYKNGVLYSTNTFNGTAPTYSDGNGLGIGCFHYSGKIYPFWGSVNDFRIYDHCLSPKEVHEIAQGLVLHYPLNNIYNTGLRNLYEAPYSAGKLYDGLTQVVSYNFNSEDECWHYVIPSKQWWHYYFPSISVNPGEIYQWSFKYRVNSSTTATNGITVRCSIQNNDTTATTKTIYTTTKNSWIEISGFREVPVGASIFKIELMTNLNNSTIYDIDIKDVMICKVSNTESIIPFINNSMFSNVVSDCSGYGNDGTIYGTPTIETDSPVHEVSTYLNSSSAIVCNTPDPHPLDQITFSIWHKGQAQIGNFENGGLGFYVKNNKWVFEVYINKAYRQATSITDVNDSWQLLTGTYDGKDLKIYINGEYEATTSMGSIYPITYNATAPWTINGNPKAAVSSISNIDNRKNGYWSDFRIYSTSLSAEDVKALYQQGASIDNLGSMHTYGEFNEGQEKISIGKNKVVSEGSVNELLSDDAAYYILGGDWRMPTRADFEELIDNTTQEYLIVDNVRCRKLTSTINGNSIILPYNRTSGSNYRWYYASSTRYESSAYLTQCRMLYSSTISDNLHIASTHRYNPFSIRSVSPTQGVDLGLSSGLRWAESNLTVNGLAPNITDYGDYFAWGEVEPKTSYSWSTYKWNPSGDGSTMTKYNATDGLTILERTSENASKTSFHRNSAIETKEINEE